MRWCCRILLALTVLCGLPALPHTAWGRQPARPPAVAPAPLIVVGLHGDLYMVRADGSGRHRLTVSGRAQAPMLSPDGRLVAYFLRAANQSSRTNPAGALAIVAIGAPTGTAGQAIVGSASRWYDARYTWSPDSRQLAYRRGAAFVLHAVDGRRADTMLQPPQGTSYSGDLVWSPDGRRLAVPLRRQVVTSAVPPIMLFAVGTPEHTAWQVVTVRFLPGALGANLGNITRSTPSNELAWAPDGRGLLFSTVYTGAGPPNLSGLWHVGLDGGLARLVIGTAAAVRVPPQPAYSPLQQSTYFLLSPDKTLLATDPQQRLWVGPPDGQAGRFLSVPMPPRCVLAQYLWLPDASGLAYVQLCATGFQIQVQATLFSLRRDGSAPRLLYLAVSANEQVIDLAPSDRSVQGGY